jgi:[acyl-carrier-protein] S-malonyltransferase
MSKIAFIYPGQGAQSLGMGKDLYEKFEIFRSYFDIASEALGYSMSELVFESSEDKLRQTMYTQPSILAMSIATTAVLKEFDINSNVSAGLSLGEYSALVNEEIIKFSDALKIVAKRGVFMQEEVPDGVGAMAAVLGLENLKVLDACKMASNEGIVSVANYNCPGQVVIAGEKNAVEKALEYCKEFGVKKAVTLPVSAPFHTELLIGAGEKLKKELEKFEFKHENINVYSNVTADLYSENVKDLLVKQVYSPVRWEESVKKMILDGVDIFIEIGPGDSLSKFVRKIDRSVNVYNVSDIVSLKETLKAIKGVDYEI